jgi:hypothetical protein
MEIINQPANGMFRSDLLMLSPEILAEFKAHYLKSWPRTTLHSFVPVERGAGVYVG